MFFHHTFNRYIIKNLSKTTQYHTLPESSYAPIAIAKRMDKLKFIMKYRAGNEWMLFSLSKPLKKLIHQIWHTVWRWCNMRNTIFAIYPNIAASKRARIFQNTTHHQLMRQKQGIQLFSIVFFYVVICFDGSLNLFDLPYISKNPFTFYNCSYFFFT